MEEALPLNYKIGFVAAILFLVAYFSYYLGPWTVLLNVAVLAAAGALAHFWLVPWLCARFWDWWARSALNHPRRHDLCAVQ